MNELSDVLKPHGYSLLWKKETRIIRWSEFAYALPFHSFCRSLHPLQKLGIVNLVNTADVTYGTVCSRSHRLRINLYGGGRRDRSLPFRKLCQRGQSTTASYVPYRPACPFFILGGLIGVWGRFSNWKRQGCSSSDSL